MEEIVKIMPSSDLTVAVIWSDGREARIGFTPLIKRSSIFTSMQDAGFFVKNAHIAHTGSAIAWSDVLEFSSDGLRYDALPDEYRRDFGYAAAE
jgi:hypothetical protein